MEITDEQMGPAFIVTSLLVAYPDQGFEEQVRILFQDENLGSLSQSTLGGRLKEIQSIFQRLTTDSIQLDDLRSEYIELFDRGRQVNSLYETEYGRERAMVKGNELVDIAGFYRAFGFETGGEGVQAEMIDHVAVELEFYALLLLKSCYLIESGDLVGVDIVADARRKFLTDHLGRFVGAICDRPGVQVSQNYLPIFQFCRDLVAIECRRLGVNADRQHWISGQDESTDVSCGGSVGCLK